MVDIRAGDRVVLRQVDATRDVRAHSTLPQVDYADAFILETDCAPEWTAERWARAILEDAPVEVRATLSSGWAALGLKASESDLAILGWDVRRNDPTTLLLGRDSRIGMAGELLFALRPEEGLLFATLIHHRTVATRALWAAVERPHVRIVSRLLTQTYRRTAGGDVTESAEAG